MLLIIIIVIKLILILLPEMNRQNGPTLQDAKQINVIDSLIATDKKRQLKQALKERSNEDLYEPPSSLKTMTIRVT